MIRSYNHKGFVLEIAIQTTFRLVPPTSADAPCYTAVVTISSRSGRPVAAFSPLCVADARYTNFTTAEDALMSAHTAARGIVDDWGNAVH